VVSELALSVMLLIGSGLLIKPLATRAIDSGFNPANVLGMRISVPNSQYPGSRERAVLYPRIVDHRRRDDGHRQMGCIILCIICSIGLMAGGPGTVAKVSGLLLGLVFALFASPIITWVQTL